VNKVLVRGIHSSNMLWLKATEFHKHSRLLNSKEAPEYMKEEGITTGYRQKLSYTSCITSCFLLHNETVNIWSHLIGFATFLYCLTTLVLNPPQGANSFIDLIPLYLQLITYQVCLLSSALFHTFSCHSEQAHQTWLQTDHFGIVVALFGTYVSVVHNVFHCHQDWRNFHLSVVTLLFVMISVAMWLPSVGDRLPWMKRGKDGGVPLWMFIALSLYAVIPFSHWMWLNGGLDNPVVLLRLKSMVIPFLIGGVGLCFYVSRFPENFLHPEKTGYFDLFGASHQVWHVMIFLGMFCWYYESVTSLSGSFQNDSCANSGQFKNHHPAITE